MEKQKSNYSPSVVLSGLILVGVICFSGFIVWKERVLAQELSRIETSVANVQQQIQQLNEEDQVQEKGKKLETLQALEAAQRPWSEIALNIFKTVLQVPGLSVQSLTSDDKGVFNLQITSQSLESLEALIVAVRNHPTLGAGFIPSLSKGEESGYRAQFEFNYPLQ